MKKEEPHAQVMVDSDSLQALFTDMLDAGVVSAYQYHKYGQPYLREMVYKHAVLQHFEEHEYLQRPFHDVLAKDPDFVAFKQTTYCHEMVKMLLSRQSDAVKKAPYVAEVYACTVYKYFLCCFFYLDQQYVFHNTTFVERLLFLFRQTWGHAATQHLSHPWQYRSYCNEFLYAEQEAYCPSVVSAIGEAWRYIQKNISNVSVTVRPYDDTKKHQPVVQEKQNLVLDKQKLVRDRFDISLQLGAQLAQEHYWQSAQHLDDLVRKGSMLEGFDEETFMHRPLCEFLSRDPDFIAFKQTRYCRQLVAILLRANSNTNHNKAYAADVYSCTVYKRFLRCFFYLPGPQNRCVFHNTSLADGVGDLWVRAYGRDDTCLIYDHPWKRHSCFNIFRDQRDALKAPEQGIFRPAVAIEKLNNFWQTARIILDASSFESPRLIL